MNVTVRTRIRHLGDALRAYIDRRVYSSLAEFAGRLNQVTVGISDRDAGTGGPLYSCRVEARLRSTGGSLVEEASDGDLFRAIDRSMDQVGRALGDVVRSSPRGECVTWTGGAAIGQGV